MSMLSAQRDTLRVAADALEDEGVMPACAKLLRDAADTIWQLRNDLVELRYEKENLTRLLREALEKKFSDEDDLRAENVKLSDLAFDLYCDLYESAPCIYSKYGSRLRELGIEVKDDD